MDLLLIEPSWVRLLYSGIGWLATILCVWWFPKTVYYWFVFGFMSCLMVQWLLYGLELWFGI